MSKRYDQYCPVAHALGLVGERWSLLIVRELLQGPKRYTDLAASLPGIGTNILAARLKELESSGLVTKHRLDPPAASQVYELTPYGPELKPVMRPHPLRAPPCWSNSRPCLDALARSRTGGSPRTHAPAGGGPPRTPQLRRDRSRGRARAPADAPREAWAGPRPRHCLLSAPRLWRG